MEIFSKRLRELRKSRRLSQQEVSIKTHISQSNISSYELGQNKPTIEAIIALCKFFNVSADYLLGLSDDLI